MEGHYNSFDEMPAILNAKDISRVLRISEPHAYRILHAKGFPTILIGKRLVVKKDSLLDWLAKNEMVGA